MPRTVLGLGSNLGDREAYLRLACARLQDRLGPAAPVAMSPIYESPPAGGPPQGPYLNAAVLAVADLTPRGWLELARSVERGLGRLRRERWGARTIDVDVLWIEGVVSGEGELVVPHPRLLERPFALRPLLDLVPGAIDPRSARPLADALEALPTFPLRRYA